jgi:hypothetical protein
MLAPARGDSRHGENQSDPSQAYSTSDDVDVERGTGSVCRARYARRGANLSSAHHQLSGRDEF